MQTDLEQLTKLKARYKFHSLIGEGGAGEVYAAWDDHLKRTVAIKRIKTSGVDDATLANPWGEAMRLAAIRHANIVAVYDMGQEDDIPYIVMEHVQGDTLNDRIAVGGPFTVPEFVEMARQTLEGMLAAHHAGLVHRDLKPSNIMLTPLASGSFQVKILDFGMAKFLATPSAQTMNLDGSITGSISWISPEQLNRQSVDARSDLYSLGCVFYFALSGKNPFDGATTIEVMTAHLSHYVVPLETLCPDLPPLLAQWVMVLLNLRPEDRYQSAMQALGGLNAISAHVLPGYSQPIPVPVGGTTTIFTPATPVPNGDADFGQAPGSNDAKPAAPLAEHPSWRLLKVSFVIFLLLMAGALFKFYQSEIPVPLTVKLQPERREPAPPASSPPAQLAQQVEVPSVAMAVPVPTPLPLATPAPTAAPVQIPVAKVIFRVHGSNTIGAKLLPALMTEFLKREGSSNIQQKPGKTAEDMRIEVMMSGAQDPKAIEIEAHGSKTAFDDLLSGKCDLGMASRQIKPEEIAAFARAGLGDLHSASSEYVLGLDGIAVVVNKDNPVSSLTKLEIARIFCGQITDWQQVGGPSGPIHLYARDSKSGTFDTFKALVLEKWELADAKRFEDSNELSDAVATDPAGIGFVGLPFIREAKALAVSEPGTAPFIATRFTVATEDYLLSRRLFLYSTSASRNNPIAKKFLEFVLSDEGQDVVHRLGFVKQTPDVQRLVAPAGAPQQYVDATKGSERLSLNLRFRPSSTQLDNKALRDMERIIDLLSQPRMQGKSLLLLGFTDSLGAVGANEKLSAERGQIVAREFAMRGFTSTRVVGLGSALPVASNDSEAGRDKNRRVEVWITQ